MNRRIFGSPERAVSTLAFEAAKRGLLLEDATRPRTLDTRPVAGQCAKPTPGDPFPA
jgi:hypothetical protein